MRILGVLVVLATFVPAAPAIGYGRDQVHPDFELPKLDGTLGKLSDFRGKHVLLFNFASW